MASAIHHAESSVRRWGGCVNDYVEIHEWFDETKAHLPDMRHRAIRHHSQGVEWCGQVFGYKLALHNEDGTPIQVERSNGMVEKKWIPVKWVAEQHVMEDMGRIPTLADWLRDLPMQPSWMAARAVRGEKLIEISEEVARRERDSAEQTV